MEREEIGNCPKLLDQLKNLMRSAQMNKQVRDFVQYDAHEISMVRSKEFPGTELWQNCDRTFWYNIQPDAPEREARLPPGHRGVPLNVYSGYSYWRRRRGDTE